MIKGAGTTAGCVLLVFMGLAGPSAVLGDVRIDGKAVRVETRTLTAVFERAVLTSLVRRSDGRELVKADARGPSSIHLVYPSQESVGLGKEPGDRFVLLGINGHRADIRIEAWDGDAVVSISDDPETGDLVVEPGAASSRPGVRACRWLVSGIDPKLELVAPFFQGIHLPLEDPLIRDTYWVWPHRWEAGLAILEDAAGGFWVHCRDTRFIYKALKVGMPGEARCLGFDTDAYGPIDENLSAGGLAWRVNVYEGDWRVPAAAYRDWLGRTCGLDGRKRPSWVEGITLALNSCPIDPAVLDALALRVAPSRVLLHLADFRADPFGENYPDFTASEAAVAFIRKAQKMGFHVFPHCPALDIDPRHPVFEHVRDFAYRELESKKLIGWTSRGEGPVPESNGDRPRHAGEHVNIRLHAGSSPWRSFLVEEIRKLVDRLSLEAVYVDVTMNTHNVHNALVENTTPSEGMMRLQRTVKSLGTGLVVAGEGRNEINMQDQEFSIVHLFKSWFDNIDGLERIEPCPLGELLFGRWSRAFGASRLSGQNPVEAFRIRRQIAFGGIPTITIGSAAEIERPNEAVAEVLRLAAR